MYHKLLTTVAGTLLTFSVVSVLLGGTSDIAFTAPLSKPPSVAQGGAIIPQKPAVSAKETVVAGPYHRGHHYCYGIESDERMQSYEVCYWE